MSKKQRWIWEAYFVIVLLFAIQNIYHLFKPGSPNFLYYSILRSFDPIFNIAYGSCVIHVFLNIIHCIPLLFYIHRVNFLNPKVWKILFILRCIFEIAGRSYEANTFFAFYHSNPKALLFILLLAIIPNIPSYFACYQYAFKTRDKW